MARRVGVKHGPLSPCTPDSVARKPPKRHPAALHDATNTTPVDALAGLLTPLRVSAASPTDALLAAIVTPVDTVGAWARVSQLPPWLCFLVHQGWGGALPEAFQVAALEAAVGETPQHAMACLRAMLPAGDAPDFDTEVLTRGQGRSPLVEASLSPDPALRLQAGQSCRAFREFGWARFLLLHVPPPPHLEAFRAVVRNGVKLAGRAYSFLHGKQSHCIMFAEACPEGPRVSVQDVWQWHVAVPQPGMPLSKLVSRMDLMFSKTRVGVEVDCSGGGGSGLHPLLHIEDVVSPCGAVMTDGCGLIGEAAMAAVAARLGLAAPPPAVQGRLGEYKGVWLMVPHVEGVAVRPSMRKWELPPASRTHTQATLEVSSVAKPGAPACLNLQLVTVLSGAGVPLDVLLDAQAAAVDLLCEVYADPRLLPRLGPWYGLGSGMAAKLAAACGVGLHAGVVGQGVRALVRRWLEAMHLKARIPIPESRWVLMVPDPTGFLEPGEVYCRVEGQALVGRLAVARNPCHLLSDVQTPTGVDLTERLAESWSPAMLADVLVCSVAGDTSLASALSGGDYDGDLAWVCWKATIVEAIVPAPPPPPIPTPPVTTTAPTTHAPGLMQATYLRRLGEWDLGLGRATNAHLAWVDWFMHRGLRRDALQAAPCAALAASLAVIVDAPKSGGVAVVPDSLLPRQRPHYLTLAGRTTRSYVSTSPMGVLHDVAGKALEGLAGAGSSSAGVVTPVDLPDPGAAALDTATALVRDYNAGLRAALDDSADLTVKAVKGELRRRFEVEAGRCGGRPALAAACYMVCHRLAADKGRPKPYTMWWEVCGEEVIALCK